MKKTIVGGLLIGLPLLLFIILLFETGAWKAFAFIGALLGGVWLLAFCMIRGLELLRGER